MAIRVPSPFGGAKEMNTKSGKNRTEKADDGKAEKAYDNDSPIPAFSHCVRTLSVLSWQ